MLSTHSLLKTTERKINIVFDIDGVLAFHSTRLSEKITAIFEKYGLVVSAAEHTHYVSPGAVELMKLLFSLPYVRVSFFSSGAKVRNDEFVEKLLSHALGVDAYREMKDDVTVLSKEDMTYYGNNEDSRQLGKLCNRLYGNYKKDISKVLRPGDSLHEAILIDDDWSYIALGQHKNLLVCPESSDHYYYNLAEGRCSFTDKYHADSFHGVNNIFYVTGLLMKLMTAHRSGGELITDALCKINYITHEEYRKNQLLKYERGEYIGEPGPDIHSSDLESCWHESMSKIDIYESGLKILNKLNPDLVMIDSEFYKAFAITEPIKLCI